MTQCNVKAKNFKTKWLKFAIHFATLCIFLLSFIGERGKLTPCKAKQPLRGMELLEKEHRKRINAYKKAVQKEPTVKIYQLILDLKPFRS